MWYDRSFPGGAYRSFRDGAYGVRVRVGPGSADESAISEDAGLTAVTVGASAAAALAQSPDSATTTERTSTLGPDDDERALPGDLRVTVTGLGGQPPSEWDAETLTRRIVDGTARIEEVGPEPTELPYADVAIPTRDIVVAALPIEAGFPIEAEMLWLATVPADASNDGAYVDPADVVGMVPAVDILAFQPITPNLLSGWTAGSSGDVRVPLQVLDQGMTAKGDVVSYAVVLRNPNLHRWAAQRMPVRVAFLDRRGRVIATARELASLLPGQEGAVVGDVSGARGTVAIEVAVADGDGNWVEHDVLVGGLDVSAIKTAQRGVRPITTGRLETYFGDWQEGVQVMAVYRDARGRIIGGDSAYLNLVPGGTTTPFRIRGSGRVPARAVESTEVYYEL